MITGSVGIISFVELSTGSRTETLTCFQNWSPRILRIVVDHDLACNIRRSAQGVETLAIVAESNGCILFDGRALKSMSHKALELYT